MWAWVLPALLSTGAPAPELLLPSSPHPGPDESDGQPRSDVAEHPAPEPCFPKLRYEARAECVHLALVRDRRWFLGVGGEVRQRVTYVQDFEFGASQTEGDWSNTQRYLLHLDLRREALFQAFVQLGSHVAVDLEGPPNPIERNDFDLRQAFLRGDFRGFRPWVGRRVLAYGSERLVSRREGPNLRRVFDGAGVELYPGDLQIELVVARPVDVDPVGVFNDFQWLENWLWGAYATIPLGWSGLDAYYLGFQEDDASYAAGVADEVRHSLGVRWFGDDSGWDWNAEAILQVGEFGDDAILAWTVASITGYTFESLPWSPRLAVSANIASGDNDPDDDVLESFNALYPRGNYFSEAAVLGPRNFWNLHGYLTLRPLRTLAATVDVNGYWRVSTADGVYGPPGNLIREPGDSDAHFVALAVSTALEWEILEFLDATAIYTHITPGAFIEETGPSPITHFVELTLRFRI